MRLFKYIATLLLVLSTIFSPLCASAQWVEPGFDGGGGSNTSPKPPAPDWEKRQRADERLKAFGSDLLGDGIDPNTGTIQFSTTDVSIPGNFGLPVSITRKMSPGRFYGRNVSAEFGDWQIEVPRLHVLTRTGYNWTGNRCTKTFDQSFPSHQFGSYTTWYRHAYTNGLTMDIPGQGSKSVLELTGSNTNLWPSGTEMVTIDGWRLTCGSANNGQGFIGHSPDGTKYRFDRFITLEADQMGSRYGGGPTMLRTRNILAATQVTDVNGNTVNYDYDGYGRLTAIRSSDSRRINLTYSGTSKLIRSVTSNPGTNEARTWTYSYAQKTFPEIYSGTVASSLIQVTQPDGLYWSYDMAGMSADPGIGAHCPQTGQTVSVTHPHGVAGTFKIGQTHQRISYHLQEPESHNCPGIPDVTPGLPVWKLAIANIMSVYEKKLSGPGMQDQVWKYRYEADRGPANTSGDDRTNTTTVTGPENIQMVYRHYWPAEPFGGKMASMEVKKNGTVLRRTDYTYQLAGAYGNPTAASGRTPNSGYIPTHMIKSVVAQDGDTFTTDLAYQTSQSSTDFSYGKPIQTKVYASMSGSTTPRVTDTTYEHKKSVWVLGLPKTVTTNGRNEAIYAYDNVGQKVSQTRYDAPYATFEYNSDGTLSWVKDALARTTSASMWKRGTPQKITRADGTSIDQHVDDNGWLTSAKDANGNTTSYQHDIMGRLTKVTRPIGFSATEISYSFGSTIQQTISRGSKYEKVTYDSLFRPTLEETGGAGTSSTFVKTAYNAAGEVSFTSFPSGSSNPSTGINMIYDGLGRIKSSTENVSPYATITHDYYSSNRHKITDPSGYWTNYFYSGYQGPGDTTIIGIFKYGNGAYKQRTYLFRNIWGEVTELKQWADAANNSNAQSHYYYYNAKRQLCRHRTPESGDTLMAYNAVGEMTSYAKGMSASSCTDPSGNGKATLTYDLLGRLLKTDFQGAGTADITNSYDDNGNLTSTLRSAVSHSWPGVSRASVNWAYTYNPVNQLTRETLNLDGRTFDLRHTYNAHGDLTREQYPTGRAVDYSLDGRGRTTMLKHAGGTTYANNMNYHASGAVSGMNYGNGQVFTQTLNARLLPTHLLSQKGSAKALDMTYGYDVRGKVTSVINGAISGDNRTYDYDALGRLTTSSGPWGSGSYNYDGLGNILNYSEGSRTHMMGYDTSKNLLTSHTDNQGPDRNIIYDSRGNVKQLGAQGFVYDRTDQAITLRYDVVGSYVYDGNKRRVKSVVDGKTTYHVYSLGGKLMHQHELTGNKKTDYIERIATVLSDNTVTYLHNDLLGSSNTYTTSAGNVSMREQYTPFGRKLNNPIPLGGEPGFTGHVWDKDTGLNYMQARYYDPLLGRFLTTDPIGFSPSRPEMFGRYTYVNNDPMNGTDPTGMDMLVFRVTVDENGHLGGTSLESTVVQSKNFGKSIEAGVTVGTGGVSGVAGKHVAKQIATKLIKKVCFEAGTLVLTKDGKRAIETVAVGDMVWSSNPETGEAGWKQVSQTFINDESTVWELIFADEKEQATRLHRVTGEHPYWVVSAANDNETGAWVEVNALKPNMQVQTKSGKVLTVLSAQDTGVVKRTYNFEVGDFHTYYVGHAEVLVHNNCKKSPRKQVFKKFKSRKAAKNARPKPAPPKAGTNQVTRQSKNKNSTGNQGGEQHDKGGTHMHDTNHNSKTKPNVHYEFPKP